MNTIQEIQLLKKKVHALICLLGTDVDTGELIETDPTVGSHIKAITTEQIAAWNNAINLYLSTSEFVTNGKIRADKIDSLALLDTVRAEESTLQEFINNQASYEFQKNDIIAIPVSAEDTSLYLYIGDDKTIADNYLPTGLTTITIGMVEGLSDTLVGINNYIQQVQDSAISNITTVNDTLNQRITDEINTLTQDVATSVQQINQDLATKVPKTTNTVTAPNATYQYVYLLDAANNNVARMNASEIGKNVGNSNITSIANAGLTQGSTWNHNTGGFPYFVKGLTDRSSDTTYSRFKLQNTDGQEGYASNIYNALSASVAQFTQAQALELGRLFNGGQGSAGQISVNLISPPIIQNQYDSVEYILLRGANLNLNELSMGIQILASDKTTVVATIPNNQIQLSANGLELVFYYNFYNFPEAQYFIKLISGTKTYITSLDLTIVESVEPVDLAGITWAFVYEDGITPGVNDLAISGNFNVETPDGQNASPKVSLKSSEIFAQGEDFLIEMTVTLSRSYNPNDSNRSYIGIGYSSTPNSTIVSSQVNVSYASISAPFVHIYNNQEGNAAIAGDTPVTFVVTFIKTGNLFRTIIGTNNFSKTLSNNDGYSIFIQLVGRYRYSVGNYQVVSGQITKAYKL